MATVFRVAELTLKILLRTSCLVPPLFFRQWELGAYSNTGSTRRHLRGGGTSLLLVCSARLRYLVPYKKRNRLHAQERQDEPKPVRDALISGCTSTGDLLVVFGRTDGADDGDTQSYADLQCRVEDGAYCACDFGRRTDIAWGMVSLINSCSRNWHNRIQPHFKKIAILALV